MNDSEKKFFYLAMFLFALGGISRFGIFNELSPFETISLPINQETAVAITTGAESPDTDSLTVSVEDSLSLTEEPKSKRTKAPKKKAPEFPLSINTASKDDLCFIKGVGPSLAQKIIDHRETKGNFRSAKDLEKVSGIGAKKRKSIEEFVRFD